MQPCSFLCLWHIQHYLVLPNLTVWVAKISEPHPHELATLTTSLAGEDPVICSPVTDISLHWWGQLSQVCPRQSLNSSCRRIKKKYQDCTNGEGTCWSYNLDFILCLLMRIIIYVVVIQKWDWRYITMLYYLDRATLNFRRPLVCLTDFRILRVNGFSFIPKMNNVLLHAFPTVPTQNSCQLPVDKDQMRDTVIYG